MQELRGYSTSKSREVGMIMGKILKRVLAAILPILVKEGAAYYKNRRRRGVGR
ncbi:hypothetical protein ACFOU2_18635 [Bacillus songklensis]|uniref:Transposase n=1 Tax=Bacillus songklensis TaxID=1069116 RepID=A0ABV8B875_9BACI